MPIRSSRASACAARGVRAATSSSARIAATRRVKGRNAAIGQFPPGVFSSDNQLIISRRPREPPVAAQGGRMGGKRIALVGAGAIGGYVGGYLARNGYDVTLIDPWPEHIEAIRRNGLELTGVTEEERCVVQPPTMH